MDSIATVIVHMPTEAIGFRSEDILVTQYHNAGTTVASVCLSDTRVDATAGTTTTTSSASVDTFRPGTAYASSGYALASAVATAVSSKARTAAVLALATLRVTTTTAAAVSFDNTGDVRFEAVTAVRSLCKFTEFRFASESRCYGTATATTSPLLDHQSGFQI